MRKLLVVLFCISQFGCATATSFYGNAKIEGGPAGCQKICEGWGMTLAGMVALGDYTDGCICQAKESKLSVRDVGESLLQSGAGGAGGIEGAEREEERDWKWWLQGWPIPVGG
jgi:hypothetical protein